MRFWWCVFLAANNLDRQFGSGIAIHGWPSLSTVSPKSRRIWRNGQEFFVRVSFLKLLARSFKYWVVECDNLYECWGKFPLFTNWTTKWKMSNCLMPTSSVPASIPTATTHRQFQNDSHISVRLKLFQKIRPEFFIQSFVLCEVGIEEVVTLI